MWIKKKRKRSELSEFNCPFNEQCNTLYYPMLMARLCITDNRAVQTYAGPTDKKNYARPPYSARAGPVRLYKKHVHCVHAGFGLSGCLRSQSRPRPDLTGDSWPTKGPSRPRGHPRPRVVWHPDTFYSRQVCGEWTDTVHTICPPCA